MWGMDSRHGAPAACLRRNDRGGRSQEVMNVGDGFTPRRTCGLPTQE